TVAAMGFGGVRFFSCIKSFRGLRNCPPSGSSFVVDAHSFSTRALSHSGRVSAALEIGVPLRSSPKCFAARPIAQTIHRRLLGSTSSRHIDQSKSFGLFATR